MKQWLGTSQSIRFMNSDFPLFSFTKSYNYPRIAEISNCPCQNFVGDDWDKCLILQEVQEIRNFVR